jgi:hypothetical protein
MKKGSGRDNLQGCGGDGLFFHPSSPNVITSQVLSRPILAFLVTRGTPGVRK